MYFAVITARPKPGTPESKKYSTAAIACWINFEEPVEARRRALAFINTSAWRPLKVLEESIINDDHYPPDSPSREYYEQCLIDDEVCVIYTAPGRPSRKTKSIRR